VACACVFCIQGTTAAQKRRVFMWRYFRIQYLSFLTCKYVSTRQAPWLVWWQIVSVSLVLCVGQSNCSIWLISINQQQLPISSPPWWLPYPWPGTATTLHYCNWIGWFWRSHIWVNTIDQQRFGTQALFFFFFFFQMGLKLAKLTRGNSHVRLNHPCT